jgi:tRNA (guanine-N7-)-methyltransferase
MHPLFFLSEAIPPDSKEEMARYFFNIFGNTNPLVVEIGSGNGHFLIEYAMRHPDRNLIGTEILAGRARNFRSKIVKRDLRNIVVFKGDARQFVWEYLYEETVQEFIILFPDPWPKKRHHKHRILTAAFIQMLRLRMKGGGTVSIATDYAEYRDWILDEFQKNWGFINLCSQGYTEYPVDYPKTLFEKRSREEKREIYFIRFKKS